MDKTVAILDKNILKKWLELKCISNGTIVLVLKMPVMDLEVYVCYRIFRMLLKFKKVIGGDVIMESCLLNSN